MWKLTWQLISWGVPLRFSVQHSISEIQSSVQQYQQVRRRKTRKKRSKIAVNLHGKDLKVSTAQPYLFALPKPVYYARLVEESNSTLIKGRFQFQVLVRACFWLILIGAVAYETIQAVRLVNNFLDAVNLGFILANVVFLLAAPIFLGVLFRGLVKLTTRSAQDIPEMTDSIQTLFT